MQPHDLRRLPIRVRPLAFETPASYEARLLAANRVGVVRYKHVVRWRETPEAMEAELEQLGGLTRGHFSRERGRLPRHPDGATCEKCTTGLGERYACTRCSRGDVVRQHAHDGLRVCRRHRRWVGVGPVDQQAPATAAVIKADKTYGRMKRRGDLDANRLAELEDFIDRWTMSEHGHTKHPAERFVLAVAVAQAISNTTLMSRARRFTSVKEMYLAIDHIIGSAVGEPAVSLVDDVWKLLRPMPTGVRRGPHDFALVELTDGAADATEHFSQLRTCPLTRGDHLHGLMYATSTSPAGRSRGKRHQLVTYACERGHVYSSPQYKLARAGSTDGCPVCSGRTTISGVNSLADTHPEIAAQWHPTKNGALRPDQVAPGSATFVYWLCAEGHAFRCSLNQRTTTGNRNCGLCANQTVEARVNSLGATHPVIAREWHPTRNGALTADEVVAGSGKRVWWRCSKGHDVQLPVEKRVRAAACSVCTGRRLTDDSNLAATHPDVASRWHPTLNGALRPENVRRMAATPVWWRCEAGHEYRSKVRTQSQGAGCLECTNKTVGSSNSLRTLRPDVVDEFHPTKNGVFTVDNLSAMTHRKLHWQCAKGHEWVGHLTQRRQGTGCPYCRNRKVLRGFNDLESLHPELAAEWHLTMNGDLRPSDVHATAQRQMWWRCQSGHAWSTKYATRVLNGATCPVCAGQR